MTIDKAGNVGIGTNSPKSILNLYTANPELIIQDTETSSPSADASLIFAESGANGVVGHNYRIRYNNRHLIFSEGDYPNNTTEVMRFYETSAGGAINVGIGTTSPKAKLQVNGSLIVNTYSSNQGGTAGIFFREANSPGGTSSNHLYNCSIMNYAHADTTSSDGISINGYDGVSICTGSNTRNERMRIASNGYVGIGTPSPTAALSVVGGRVDGSHSVGCHLGQVTSRAFLEMNQKYWWAD